MFQSADVLERTAQFRLLQENKEKQCKIIENKDSAILYKASLDAIRQVIASASEDIPNSGPEIL